jgi:hypothetical protein
MSIEARHKGVVIATDHFVDPVDDITILPEFLIDPEVKPHVTGLWVPKSTIDDDYRARIISQIAQGAPTQFYQNDYNNDNVPKFRLIYDTSSSGGVPDTLDHLKHIVHYYSAPHMTFTISLSAFAEVVEATEKFRTYEYEENGRIIDFLLATAYPENDYQKLRRFTKMDVDEYTAHVSTLAAEYELAGVVGSGGLARYTRVGQYFCALGVCVNGAVDYTVVTEPWGTEIKKQLVTPEDTFRFATNTEVQLSRTLFDDGSGNIDYPNRSQESPETKRRISALIKGNFLSVIERMKKLPEPESIQ